MHDDKAPPHNLEAEKAVLGALMLSPAALPVAMERLTVEDFFREAHRVIYAAMLALEEEHSGIDLLTVKNLLVRRGELDAIGGPAYLASLTDGVPRSTNVEDYARIIRDKALLRRLIASAANIQKAAYESDDPADRVLDQAEQSVFDVADRRGTNRAVKVGDLLPAGFALLERLAEAGSDITGVPTGLPALDTMTAGFQPGDLVIVAARPSMGKTALVLNIAQHAAYWAGKKTVMFSLEMSKEALFMRLLAQEARIDAHRLRTGLLSPAEYERLGLGMAEIEHLPLWIDDTGALTALELRSKARRLKAEGGLDLLVIDYLQLMAGAGRFDSRQSEISAVSRSLKALAKELEIPVIALSQLSRAPDARSDHRPMLSDLRESGAIEQDADVVLFIYRDEVYGATVENEGRAELIVAKQRNGPIGAVNVAFLREYTRFEALEF